MSKILKGADRHLRQSVAWHLLTISPIVGIARWGEAFISCEADHSGKGQEMQQDLPDPLDNEERQFSAYRDPMGSSGAGALGNKAEPVGASEDQTENTRLRQINAALRMQRDQAQQAEDEAMQRMQQMIYAVSHELRTPMTSIKTGAQVIQRRLTHLLHEPGADVQVTLAAALEMLAIVLRQIDLQDRLLGDLLDLSRLESNRFEITPQLQDVASPIEAAIERLRAMYPDRSIVFHPNRAGPLNAMIDGERIRKVLDHLVLNGLTYAPKDAPVDVSLSANARQVRVEVRDQGPGLTTEEQAKIWDPFYRVPGVPMYSGSSAALGLGLYLSRAIVLRMGGQIGVHSHAGQGATFWFTFPRISVTASK